VIEGIKRIVRADQMPAAILLPGRQTGELVGIPRRVDGAGVNTNDEQSVEMFDFIFLLNR
jgi:hypothetical protein